MVFLFRLIPLNDAKKCCFCAEAGRRLGSFRNFRCASHRFWMTDTEISMLISVTNGGRAEGRLKVQVIDKRLVMWRSAVELAKAFLFSTRSGASARLSPLRNRYKPSQGVVYRFRIWKSFDEIRGKEHHVRPSAIRRGVRATNASGEIVFRFHLTGTALGGSLLRSCDFHVSSPSVQLIRRIRSPLRV